MTAIELTERLSDCLDRSGPPSSDFDLNYGQDFKRPEKLRAAAVLVAVQEADGVPSVVLTKRSSQLKHHPGQIAFPGGKIDPSDADTVAGALRETREEIGLMPENVEILGCLPPHETVTGFEVTPVIGLVRAPFDPVPEAGEVSEVFSAPLKHLMDADRYQIQSRYWRGHERFYYVVPWGPYYIWGATARILRALADRMSA